MKQSINTAPGSGSQAQYLSTLWFNLDANKSILGSPNSLTSLWKISDRKVHYVQSLKTREASSASTFLHPGMCAALNHKLCFIANSQICLVSLFLVWDLVDPCLLMHATAVVLSVMILTWIFIIPFTSVKIPNQIALSSSVLICCSCSCASHRPPDFVSDCGSFKILLFQVTFLIFFSTAIFSPYFLQVGLLLQYVALFQSGN